MKENISDDKTSDRSPLSGCAILLTALMVMVFLVVFSVMTLFRQYDEIVKFTSAEPKALEIESIENRKTELNALKGRMILFHEGLMGDGEASLALTPDEINLAINAFDAFRDLRGNFRVVGIDGDKLRIAICFRLNGKPRLGRPGEDAWMTSDPRFLIGTLVARPALLKREVVLRIDTIEVEGASVPEGFIGQMSPYRLAERYLEDPLLGPAMAALTSVKVVDGCLVLSKKPGEVPADEIGRDEVDSSGRRLFTVFGIVATGFLSVAGLVVFLGLRKKSAFAKS
jgi:hypothetical protein